jgi:hypothetical protein
MSQVFQGVYDQISLPAPATYSPQTGVIQNPRTKLLNSSVQAFCQALTLLGYAWEAQPIEGTPYTVVTTLTVPQLATTWDLDGNDLEQPLWLVPKVRAMLNTVTDIRQRAIIRRNLEAFVRGDEMTDAKGVPLNLDMLKNEVKEAVSKNNEKLEDNLIALDDVPKIIDAVLGSMIRGVEAFPMSAYVLRKTQILPPLTDISPGFEGSNEVVKTETLIQEEPTIPLNIAGALPKGVWQKKTPQATQNADGRWTYRREFWWVREADPFLYDIK